METDAEVIRAVVGPYSSFHGKDYLYKTMQWQVMTKSKHSEQNYLLYQPLQKSEGLKNIRQSKKSNTQI